MFTLLKTSASAAVLALFVMSPAAATDLGGKGDPTSANYVSPNWNGLWIGAVGGYQFSNSEKSWDFHRFDASQGDAGENDRIFTGGIDGYGAEGLFGELQLGYDQQMGRFVVGAFGGINISDAEHSQSDFIDFNGDGDGLSSSLSFKQEWGGVLGARVGILKSSDTMFYVAGGWAFGELGDVKVDGEKAFEKQETDLSGWFGEIGLETRVYNNVYLTVAGRYTDYSAVDLLNVSVADGEDTHHSSVELDKDDLAVLAGLKFKLNGGLGF